MVEREVANRDTAPQGGVSGTAGATGTGGMPAAGEVVDQVKDQAAQIKSQVADTATSKLEEQKGQAASGLDNISQVVRKTGDELRSQDQDRLAGYIDQAAEQLDRATGYLRNSDMRQIVRDVESFARREPTLFIGGAFALGLLGARFLKSSTPPGGPQTRSGSATQSSLSAYSTYSSLSNTQRMPTQTNQYATGQPAYATGGGAASNSIGAIAGGTGAAGRQYQTPTASNEALSALTGDAGRSSVGMGGSVEPTMPTATTSQGTGAPDWQGGAIGRSGSAGETARRTTDATMPLPDRRGEGSSTSARSEGDAGE